MLKTRISSRLSRRLAGMLTLIITVPMMMMGVGVAHATPYVPVGHTAAGLPIYDLKDTLAPPEYSGVQIDTTNLTRDGITDVDGFNVHLMEHNNSLLTYYPTKKGASMLLHNAGSYKTADGVKHVMQAKLTVNDYNKAVLALDTSSGRFGPDGDYALALGKPVDQTIDFTLQLLDEHGSPLPASTQGTSGYQDLDGDPNHPYEEGIELMSGFDGAYVPNDTHLAQYGTNGWYGGSDANQNLDDAHARQHYLGATFTGNTVRHRYRTQGVRQTSILPIASTIAYTLTYDPNASDTNNGVPVTDQKGIPTVGVKNGCLAYYVGGDTINLATGAKDGDCWDSSQLTRPGYTFKGWSPDRNASEPQAQITMPHENTTVYAIWVRNVRFTYDADKPAEYTGTMPNVPGVREFSPGVTVPNVSDWKTGATTILRGYRFDGWKTGRDDKSADYGFDTTPITRDTTVYGAWTPLTVNLHYDANGGQGSHASQSTRWDSTVTIPGNVNDSFHRDGFKLTGWNTSPDGKGERYAPNGVVHLTDHDRTLYAQWEPIMTTMPATGSRTLAWMLAGGIGVFTIAAGAAGVLMRFKKEQE
ncbi:InlB B-repeat-containing protein [Bifidobacterium animalis]|uniref:InlB B-repeat-containing protein n=1 Tax=Bifidobacterium animalis TaxID=28025 RepID=UPI00214A37DE|nr:InlB B-repeat-containing protein [Bifidobacterium animalis]MCR1995070.1 InlB B-repeat-containing protein [Bifidobacterium animalis subsp. animalis]